MPSPNATNCKQAPARSADAILAQYLEQQERRLSSPRKAAPPHKLDCRNLSGRRDSPAGLLSPADETEAEPSANPIVQIQRKFLALFYIYVLVIVSLYLAYAVYCYYQQSEFKRLQQLQQQQEQQQQPQARHLETSEQQQQQPALLLAADAQQQQIGELQAKLENKIHLLERYIELLALDLEGAKTRLGEREKCACSIGCSFNGTQYNEGQSWPSKQDKCELCRCQAGRISCQPRVCPKLSCQDDPEMVVQTRPGQCCPSCMKRCKANQMLVRHGHSFKPLDPNGRQTKQCKCFDGLIKCEPLPADQQAGSRNKPQVAQRATANRTIEYLKSILGAKFVVPKVA